MLFCVTKLQCRSFATLASLRTSLQLLSESPLNTWKRPESVCGEFAGRTTGFSAVVGFSLTDATSVAIWTSRLDGFLSQLIPSASQVPVPRIPPPPSLFRYGICARGVTLRCARVFVRLRRRHPLVQSSVGPCLNRPTPRVGGGLAGFPLKIRPADFGRLCHSSAC